MACHAVAVGPVSASPSRGIVEDFLRQIFKALCEATHIIIILTSNNACYNQIRLIQCRTKADSESVSELSTFVNLTGEFRICMAKQSHYLDTAFVMPSRLVLLTLENHQAMRTL
jgi:hypothetical protein